MTDIDFSVVVCAYTARRWEALVEAVGSVRRQTLPPQEILVVIDDNEALLARVASEMPGVVAIPNGERTGLAGARNTGVAAARGAVIAFLDDDAKADPQWLAGLAAVYADDRAIGVGGAVLPMWEEQRPWWFPCEFDWVVGCSHCGMPGERAVVRNLIGANMSFRRYVFDVERFYSGLGHARGKPLGGEETDLCIRIGKRWPNHIILYDPSIVVCHHVPADRTRWSYFMRRCYNEGRSKGVLTSRVGRRHGLSAERTYALRTLPAAFVRPFHDSRVLRQPLRIFQAPAVALGFTLTLLGYVLSRATQRAAVS